jgi:putative phosphoribosyl transferase
VAERFRDRTHAGQRLAERLSQLAGRDDVAVLALPRGGVPVGAQVASALGATLDVLPVRKLGVPGREELALGAVAAGGTVVLNPDVMKAYGTSSESLAEMAKGAAEDLSRQAERFRGGRPGSSVEGRVAVIVDDGLATGATMGAAVAAVRAASPALVVVAVPVAPRASCEALMQAADDVVCVSTPRWFTAVGEWYDDFAQVGDEEVTQLLARFHPRTHEGEGEA